jgi:quercetin dioxygenase-like cupin family protein
MENIGSSKRPTNSIIIKSERFILESMRTFYATEKQANIAHDPHTEAKIEICAVIKGRLNYAMSGFCDDYFDVLPLKKGQVAVLLPGVYHTASADAKEDGEHMCIKLFPLACDEKCDELEKKAPVEASQVVTESLDKDVDEYFQYERSLEIIETGSINLPGYNKLHVKEVQYRHNEKVGSHKDTHDLVALTISGSITVEAGNTTFLLPEHQFAFIPAGVSHGFEASHGPALVLFIEVE